MSLLFVDSFDHYATADIHGKYDLGGGTIVDRDSLGNPEPRNGPQCIEYGSNGNLALMKVFDNHTTWIMGVGIRTDAAQGGTQDRDIFRVGDNIEASVLDTQLSLQYVADTKKFRVVRGNDIVGTVLATSTGTFDLHDNWHYLEFQCVINNTTGSFSAQFDGIEIDGLTQTNQDTRNGSNDFANTISLRTMAQLPATDLWYDDLYIANGSVPGVQAMLGDMRIDALFPKADGNYEELDTSSGTDSFALVNSMPPNGDTDYIEHNTAEKKSTFDMDEAANAIIHGVQHSVYIRKTDVNRRKVKHLIRIAGSDIKGDDVRMGDRFTIKPKMWEFNPATNLQWISSGVNGAEFGLEVV